jgi:hypothetical protein
VRKPCASVDARSPSSTVCRSLRLSAPQKPERGRRAGHAAAGALGASVLLDVREGSTPSALPLDAEARAGPQRAHVSRLSAGELAGIQQRA